MDLISLKNDDISEYDNLVKESPDGTIFHKSWWLKCMEQTYGIKAPIFGIYNSDKLVSAMPFPYKKKFGMTLIYPPFITPYLGPVFIDKVYDSNYKRISWKKSINIMFAKKMRSMGKCLYYPFFYSAEDMMPYIWEEYAYNINYTYLLDISDLEKVWNGMERNKRKRIKANEKDGMIIREGTTSELYSCLAASMGRKGHPSLSSYMIEQIVGVCLDNKACRIFSAELDGSVLGSALLVWDEKRSYDISAGVQDNSHNAMTSLIWEMIKYTKNVLDLKTFDFEGSCHSTIENFFRTFNGELIPYYSIQENSALYIIAQKTVRRLNRLRNANRY